MFDKTRIPIKLEKSPIKKAIIEMHYEGYYPEQALYGLLMDSFNLHQTPISQLPLEVRTQDINLKYQVILEGLLKEIDESKYFFGIGNESIQFTVLDKYLSWNNWIPIVNDAVEKLIDKKIIKKVNTITLQYIDIFDTDISKNINAQIYIDNIPILMPPLSISSTIMEKDVKIGINIGTPININGVLTEEKSLIDIKCSRDFISFEDFRNSYKDVLENEHALNKRYFFGLLKQDLLESLGPKYE